MKEMLPIMVPFIKEKINDYLTRITPFGFTGTVLIASGEEIIHSAGYGLANRSKKIENTIFTYHDIGSLTKQFTAAGILKLEMEGKLTTEDTIDLYFECVPDEKKSITLHQLLTHTSGIHDSSSDDYEMVTKEMALDRIFSSDSYESNQFSYSNDGYSLLAAIIERVSGQSYEDFIYRNLFLPANMQDTGYTLPSFEADRIANGYVINEDFGKPTEKNYPYWNLMGNGGMLSTSEDLYKWHRALRGETILSKVAKRKLFTPFLKDYAYGWRVIDTTEGTVHEHGGASSYGTCAHFRRYVEKDVVVIVLCNQFSGISNQMAKVVSDKLSKILFGQDVSIPPKVVADKNQNASIKAGSYLYQINTGGHFTINAKDDRMTLETFDQDAIQLFLGLVEETDVITKSSLEITKDIMNGNYLSLETNMGDQQVFQGRRSFIENYLSEKTNFKSLKLSGSLPSTIIPETTEVRILLSYEEEDVTLLFFWKNDQIHFLGFSVGIGPISIECTQNKDTYTCYSIEHESAITFMISDDEFNKVNFISSAHSANRIKEY
jgi:CubicO group peptidase (beta-lactamase class C family)